VGFREFLNFCIAAMSAFIEKLRKSEYRQRRPLRELHQPGTFAALRWYRGECVCPGCGEPNSRTVGTATHGKARLRRYQCINQECRITFNEYSGTLLEDSHLTAAEWLAINYWSRMHSAERPFPGWIAKQLKLTPQTIYRRLRELKEQRKLRRFLRMPNYRLRKLKETAPAIYRQLYAPKVQKSLRRLFVCPGYHIEVRLGTDRKSGMAHWRDFENLFIEIVHRRREREPRLTAIDQRTAAKERLRWMQQRPARRARLFQE